MPNGHFQFKYCYSLIRGGSLLAAACFAGLSLISQVNALEVTPNQAKKANQGSQISEDAKGAATKTPQDKNHSPDEKVDRIAREIRKRVDWRILDWKPKQLDNKLIYQFKLLNRKKGRIQTLDIDPALPKLDLLDD